MGSGEDFDEIEFQAYWGNLRLWSVGGETVLNVKRNSTQLKGIVSNDEV